MSGSVGIVVPAYRPDAARLSEYVLALHERLAPATIRIELDAPRPETLDALPELPAVVNGVPQRRGKGAAITAGFEALATDVLCFADADGSTPTDSVAKVVAQVADDRGVDGPDADDRTVDGANAGGSDGDAADGGADLAVGSRRHPDAAVAGHQTFARRRLGDGFAWLARRLVDPPLFDYQCGAKALSRRGWEAVRSHLYEPGFAWDIELVAMAGALDLRVTEVPIEWEDRPDSTVAPLRTPIELAQALLAARHRAKRLRENPLHEAIAEHRPAPTALIDRHE